MCIDGRVKYPLFVSDCNETWIFSTHFREIFKYRYMKMRPVGAEVFHADGRTYGRTANTYDEANSRFCERC